MADLWLPAGPDPLTGHRVESCRVDLLTRTEAPAGLLDGVAGGRVTQNVHRPISGGGQLDVVDVGDNVDWLNARVRVWWEVAGVEPWPLGTFLCMADGEARGQATTSREVVLLDKLLILDEDRVESTYSVAAGAVVTDVVADLIASAGESAVAITDSAETLTSGQVWEPGTSKLRIINDLLDAINYFSLRCDGYGRYVAAPYQAPAQRPVEREFIPGEASIHLPELRLERKLSDIPNRVVLVSAGGHDEPALVGVAENTDPGSRFSYPARGRWIVHVEEGVEATSQSVIDSLAARRLTERSTVAAAAEIRHAAVPLALNDVARLADGDLDMRAAVQSWDLVLQPGELMRTTIREVQV